jgi:hypothetical protein
MIPKEALVKLANTNRSKSRRKPASPLKANVKTTESKAPAKVRNDPAKAKAAKKTPAGKPPQKNTSGSKQDSVVVMLRRPEGATLDSLVKATGWQPHSVRGFLAGTIRKKLKLQLISEKVEGVRTYRLGSGKPTKATAAAGAGAA